MQYHTKNNFEIHHRFVAYIPRRSISSWHQFRGAAGRIFLHFSCRVTSTINLCRGSKRVPGNRMWRRKEDSSDLLRRNCRTILAARKIRTIGGIRKTDWVSHLPNSWSYEQAFEQGFSFCSSSCFTKALVVDLFTAMLRTYPTHLGNLGAIASSHNSNRACVSILQCRK